MINKKQSRLRRARATRARILLQKVDRLTVHRTNLHIYASIISADNGRTLVSAPLWSRKCAPSWQTRLAAVAMSPLPRSLALVSPRRPRLPVSNPALLTVRATVTTAASLRSLKLRAKLASSSNQGLANG